MKPCEEKERKVNYSLDFYVTSNATMPMFYASAFQLLVVDNPSDKYFFLSASEFGIFADGILARK